jgi:hypothetical protein
VNRAHREVWLHDVEQLAHHGRHAAEVRGPAAAAQAQLRGSSCPVSEQGGGGLGAKRASHAARTCSFSTVTYVSCGAEPGASSYSVRGSKTTSTPSADSFAWSPSGSRGYTSKSSPGANCVGLT